MQGGAGHNSSAASQMASLVGLIRVAASELHGCRLGLTDASAISATHEHLPDADAFGMRSASGCVAVPRLHLQPLLSQQSASIKPSGSTVITGGTAGRA